MKDEFVYVGSTNANALYVPSVRFTAATLPVEALLQAIRGHAYTLLARHAVTGAPLGWINTTDLGQGATYTARDAVDAGIAVVDWP